MILTTAREKAVMYKGFSSLCLCHFLLTFYDQQEGTKFVASFAICHKKFSDYLFSISKIQKIKGWNVKKKKCLKQIGVLYVWDWVSTASDSKTRVLEESLLGRRFQKKTIGNKRSGRKVGGKYVSEQAITVELGLNPIGDFWETV